ncbi:hypothetical protein SAMN02910456_00151 [Ruminococcaceae bacterium YRB3002]|nr:hypothetical protein SAMN02910456_00151 [Ruminococcaceae bacterium YRB3002]
MDYRQFGSTYYIRIDRGEEIISTILDVCRRENIVSAIFSGIGGCGSAEIQTFIPDRGEFETEEIHGMLELVSMNGSIVCGENRELLHHTHAVFAYKENGEHKVAGGHIKSATVLYTGEIELRPVTGGVIGKKYDPETGTGFWDFDDK